MSSRGGRPLSGASGSRIPGTRVSPPTTRLIRNPGPTGGGLASARIVQLTKENESLRAELERFKTNNGVQDLHEVIAEKDNEIEGLKSELDGMKDEIDHLDLVHGKLEDKWRRSVAASAAPEAHNKAFRALGSMSDVILRVLQGDDVTDDMLPSRPELHGAEDVYVQLKCRHHLVQ